MLIPLILGAGIGFLGAIPVAGPISALVLKLGLKLQAFRGLLLAIGASVAEAVYVLLAFLGFNFLFSTLPYFDLISRVLAGLILLGLGAYFTFSRSGSSLSTTGGVPPVKKRKELALGFTISILNPTLIASWTTVITTLSTYRLFDFTTVNAISFSIGVSLGIVSWFALMLALIRWNHNRLKVEWIRWILVSIGVLLMGLGAVQLIKLFS